MKKISWVLADYEDFIQPDASINPGNGGGALADLDGTPDILKWFEMIRSSGSLSGEGRGKTK